MGIKGLLHGALRPVGHWTVEDWPACSVRPNHATAETRPATRRACARCGSSCSWAPSGSSSCHYGRWLPMKRASRCSSPATRHGYVATPGRSPLHRETGTPAPARCTWITHATLARLICASPVPPFAVALVRFAVDRGVFVRQGLAPGPSGPSMHSGRRLQTTRRDDCASGRRAGRGDGRRRLTYGRLPLAASDGLWEHGWECAAGSHHCMPSGEVAGGEQGGCFLVMLRAC